MAKGPAPPTPPPFPPPTGTAGAPGYRSEEEDFPWETMDVVLLVVGCSSVVGAIVGVLSWYILTGNVACV